MNATDTHPKRPFGFTRLLGTTAVGFALLAAAVAVHGSSDKSPSAAPPPFKLPQNFTVVTKRVAPAVVAIKVEKVHKIVLPNRGLQELEPWLDQDQLWRFFGNRRGSMSVRPRQWRSTGEGSGFVFDSRGYILTNNHVVGHADTVTVTLADGRELKAKVIGSDPKTDVAVIKVEADKLPVLALGNSDQIEVGQWVLALGSPFGLPGTVTSGIVSAKGRSSVGITDYEDFIQTDAAINPGNSGGPLVDLRGEAIGINTAIVSRSGGSMGVGFAIPINMVRDICNQLMDHGSVTRGYLGIAIQRLTPELAASFGLKTAKGILVGDVTKDSPAGRAGLQRGDVIVQLGDQDIDRLADLRNRVAQTKPGSKVSLMVERGGKRQTFEVKVGELPNTESAENGAAEAPTELGLSVGPLDDQLREKLGYAAEQGVVVLEVQSGSMAARAGIRAGMLIKEVNRQAVTDLREFHRAMEGVDKGSVVLLLVQDGRYSRYVTLRQGG